MDAIYAPWRQAYAGKVQDKKNDNVCVFCQMTQAKDDKKFFIVKRYDTCFVVLNTYPYNAGHVMVIPNKHCANLENLTTQESAEFMHAITQTVILLKENLNPDGLNLGMNLGKLAGAGIPDHLHFHILPRWAGDTNFMPLIAGTKQISFDLHKIYEQIIEKK